MDTELQWHEGTVDFRLALGTEFYYRHIIDCIKYLLRQKMYADFLVWAPVKEQNAAGERIYHEMHTGNWWWKTQEELPVGSTLVPILLASDGTHLTNYSGDKKIWPVYMSIGNITSSVRNTPSMHAWIPIAMPPTIPKRVNRIVGYSIGTQEEESLQVIHDILTHILHPLTDMKCQKGIEMICADEQVRLCFPRLCCWLADHMENAILHGIYQTVCISCTVPAKALGNGDKYPDCDHQKYADAYKNSDTKGLHSDGVKFVNNALWTLLIAPPDLVRGDLLHNIYLGILEHMMGWIQEFLTHHNQLVAFDFIWKRLPPYPSFNPPGKAYRSITQWTSKELRNVGKVILASFAAALRRTSDQERPTSEQIQEFHQAILCIWYLTDFCLMAQYKVHTSSIIGYMNYYLQYFHRYKDIFLRYRAPKASKDEAAIAHRQLTAEHRLQNMEKEETATVRNLKKKESLVEWQHLVKEILEQKSHFNFPKIHLISHFSDQISKYGSLPQYSTEICESLHKQLKQAYHRSNKVDAMPQILQTYTRSHAFAMRDKNISAWSKELPEVKNQIRNVIKPT
ncbi:hypothetical protein BDZ91DRAFT_785483 [Kalaharituber pfeilii]|nr:hypothetical protein BDZ91DRAFT_785483 [Kalaharituber pfeilii]